MPLKYLGPFIGYTQSSEVKIWLHKTGMVAGEIELVYVAIKKSASVDPLASKASSFRINS